VAAPEAGRIQYGKTYSGRATFYGATGGGNCSYEASSDLMVGAMNQVDYDNSRSCGAYLAVTGPSGKTITIKVVDRCPECPPGAIDLSRQAFILLASASTGQIPITWKLVSPALSTPVSYVYKSGSSQYWCGIQVRGHRNPVATLELKTGGGWQRIPRQEYNYFVSENGAGCGGTIRITDIFGHRLTDSGIGIRPDTAQRGHAQFTAPD
jgi:expansin (peptidoglycan-binding protein)